MKGFIEVNVIGGNTQITTCIQSIPINDIIRLYPYNNKSVIITKKLVSRYECSNDNLKLDLEESYEQIKQLIKEAQ